MAGIASPARPDRGLLRLRSGRLWLAAVLAAAGLWLMSDGLYIRAKAVVAQVLLERAWSETLETQSPVKPWRWADTWPVARIEAPRLGKSAIVLNSVSGQALAFGPGLMEGGPRPGEPGLAIVSAHRDTHFRFLKDIAIGDEIVVTVDDGAEMRFAIQETGIVEAGNSGLYQHGDAAQLALVTCWPFDAKMRGAKRFVALAERVDN